MIRLCQIRIQPFPQIISRSNFKARSPKPNPDFRNPCTKAGSPAPYATNLQFFFWFSYSTFV